MALGEENPVYGPFFGVMGAAAAIVFSCTYFIDSVLRIDDYTSPLSYKTIPTICTHLRLLKLIIFKKFQLIVYANCDYSGKNSDPVVKSHAFSQTHPLLVWQYCQTVTLFVFPSPNYYPAFSLGKSGVSHEEQVGVTWKHVTSRLGNHMNYIERDRRVFNRCTILNKNKHWIVAKGTSV